MNGGVAALLVVMTWLAPDGFLLGERLQSPDDLPALPLEELVHTAAFLDIEPSMHRGTPYVLYVGHGTRTQGLWPRLHYAAPVFSPNGDDFLPRHRLGLDVVEYWAHGLVLAWFDGRRRAQDPYLDLATQRAMDVMPEVPQAARLQVYLEAVADFAAQAVSSAHEIDRTRRRWQALGRDICALRQPEIPLMRHWQGLFERAGFRGVYRADGFDEDPVASDDRIDTTGEEAATREPQWATTRRGLARIDKDLVVQHLFAGRWTGDPEQDFASLCGEAHETTSP